MVIEQINLNEITEYEKNAKKHDEIQIKNVMESIKEFGMVQPLVIDQNNTIIIGHCRFRALKRLKWEEVPCVRIENLSENEINKLRLLDNKLNESEWNFDLLTDQIAEIDWSDFDIDWDILETDEEEIEIHEDSVPEIASEESFSKKGDIWLLGEHKLVCGDSTNIDTINKLMNGNKADCVFTDPPYNVASDSKNFAANVSKAMDDLSNSEWDKNFDINKVLDNILVNISENATVYICTSHFLAPEIWNWMKKWSNHYSYCVWSKPNPMPSLAKRHWTWNTELICYATRGKHTFNFPAEGHALSTWTINKKNGTTGHPTEKPIEVPAMGISHSSKKDDIILDLFGGSGSTLIACEQLGRKCFMCEIDEHYVDVIVKRYIDFTNNKNDVYVIRDGQKIKYSEI